MVEIHEEAMEEIEEIREIHVEARKEWQMKEMLPWVVDYKVV